MRTATTLFDPTVLAAWGQQASTDALVCRHAVLAELTFGLHNTQTGEQAWLAIHEDKVHAGAGQHPVAFTLEGNSDAFADLATGFPFNRLVRQHQILITGDLRRCVHNWMLLYALMRVTSDLEI